MSNMGPYTVGDRDLARHESSLLYLSLAFACKVCLIWGVFNIDKSHPLMTIWDLSNMGWVLSNMGWVGVCQIWAAGFVTYGGHGG